MADGNNCYHAPLDHQSSLKWSDGNERQMTKLTSA